MLADAPMIVGRNCGETWPSHEHPARRQSSDHRRRMVPTRDIGEARRKPIVTYSGAVDSAWAAKVDGDILPIPAARRSRIPQATAALASLLVVGAFLGGREAAVAALPDLAGLYGSIGLPVNLDGLEIRGVRAERAASEPPGRISVRGEIVNTSRADLPVPPLQVSLLDAGKTLAGSRGFDPPGRTLKRGESAPFTLQLDDVPDEASDVVLRFRTAGDPGPGPVPANLRGSAR